MYLCYFTSRVSYIRYAFAYPNNKNFSATLYRLTEHSSERLESSFMEYHNPTLRVLRILELIDANSGGLSLSEISNLLDLPKGTISPILKTLAATNYFVTD